jgi:hypothetical protein
MLIPMGDGKRGSSSDPKLFHTMVDMMQVDAPSSMMH